ncbi:hypothetical protein EW026_g2574 [Hermanssonia centrifuga]|uniref:Uncharacterized protein n=1 Tax=Hermanssonia centrifuga TaxID=98765 RepID=A0A4S4KNU8_9APHY|nr:hypothetical protein EW026_g2574 [Hermanssonia centrifuga]
MAEKCMWFCEISILKVVVVLGSWPSLSDIEQELNLDPSSSELSNISTSALLIPSYANLTQDGWNICFYGLAYKLPQNILTSELNSIINGFKAQNLNSTETALL